MPTSVGEYSLLSNASATGVAVDVPAGRYVFALQGTLGGATVTLQMLGPDGETYMSVGTDGEFTGAGAVEVALPAGPVRASVAGGPPAGLYASLRYLGE